MATRRITLRSAAVNENEVGPTGAGLGRIVGKPPVQGLGPRRVLAEQKNNQDVNHRVPLKSVQQDSNVSKNPLLAGGACAKRCHQEDCLPEVAIKRSAAFNQIRHPEVQGIEREYGVVDFCDDVYEYLLDKQHDWSIENNFLSIQGGANAASAVKMRMILIDWLVQVHGRFHLLPETMHLTVYILDSYLSVVKVDKTELQLVGITCMLIASKYEEMYAPGIAEFVFVADNAYNKKQIMKVEIKILQAIQYNLFRPHSLTFLRWMSKEISASPKVHNLGKYFGELALLDSGMSHVAPAEIAAASLCLAFRLEDEHGDMTKACKMAFLNEEEVDARAALMARFVVKTQSQPKLQAIKTKYSTVKTMCVSKLSEEQQATLLEISGSA